MKTSRKEPIEPICDSGDDKRYQRPNKLLVEKQRDKDWYQRHPKDGQHVWQGDNARGHETISDFEFAIADWAKRRPGASTHLRNNQAGAGEISHYRWISHAQAMPGSAARAPKLPVDNRSELAGPPFPVRA